jgi:mRNA-degrading endonuclease RelE of RelBE toxin-antitoxin system
MALAILATPSFARIAKKLHPQDKAALDAAVQAVASSPALGEEKRGDLNGVFVYKFKFNKQETLLAYRLQPDKLAPEALVLLAVGPHENVYAQLKR